MLRLYRSLKRTREERPGRDPGLALDQSRGTARGIGCLGGGKVHPLVQTGMGADLARSSRRAAGFEIGDTVGRTTDSGVSSRPLYRRPQTARREALPAGAHARAAVPV